MAPTDETTEKLRQLKQLAEDLAAALSRDVTRAVGGESAFAEQDFVEARVKKCTSGFFCGQYNCKPPFSCSDFGCTSQFAFGVVATARD